MVTQDDYAGQKLDACRSVLIERVNGLRLLQ
jgi:hypothetical protein